MTGIHVTESVRNDGQRSASVSGPDYVSCEVVPAPEPKGYWREVKGRGEQPPCRHWYPSYEEALAAAVNYAGSDPH
ncbi:hypothetical protein WDZ92_31040 [Nostoc sp. NIES-2111]